MNEATAYERGMKQLTEAIKRLKELSETVKEMQRRIIERGKSG